MNPYNKVARYGGEDVTSVKNEMLHFQFGRCNASNFSTYYIPCDLKQPVFLSIMPVDAQSKEVLQAASGASAGWYADLETLYTRSSVSALTGLDYATGVAFTKGQIFNSTDNLQYITIKSATTGLYGTGASVYSTVASAFAKDLEERRIVQINPVKWIKITMVPNATKVTFDYKIEGYHPY